MALKSLRERAQAVSLGPLVEQFKTIVFMYVVLTRLVKVHRHLRARGLRTTLVEFWTWLNKVCARHPSRSDNVSLALQNILLFALKCLPAQRKKAEEDIRKVKLTIEDKLVPQGEAVARHTSLPPQGHSPEWITGEMEKMDAEIEHAEWKRGKISGAVYRA